MLKQYYEKDKIEIGLDEAGRGCLFGPVCVAGVVWLDEDPTNDNKFMIKDSKKIKPEKRGEIKDYIKDTTPDILLLQEIKTQNEKTN